MMGSQKFSDHPTIQGFIQHENIRLQWGLLRIELEKAENIVTGIKQRIEEIHTTTGIQAGQALSRWEFARVCEADLQNFALAAAEEYKARNLRYRPDGLCPDFFADTPEFTFRTFFSN